MDDRKYIQTNLLSGIYKIFTVTKLLIEYKTVGFRKKAVKDALFSQRTKLVTKKQHLESKYRRMFHCSSMKFNTSITIHSGNKTKIKFEQ